MKKLIVIIILIIIVVVIALMAPPITSKTITPTDKQNANLPTPKPTPLLKIDGNSNLSEEIKKLDVPDYQSDYEVLDKSLENF